MPLRAVPINKPVSRLRSWGLALIGGPATTVGLYHATFAQRVQPNLEDASQLDQHLHNFAIPILFGLGLGVAVKLIFSIFGGALSLLQNADDGFADHFAEDDLREQSNWDFDGLEQPDRSEWTVGKILPGKEKLPTGGPRPLVETVDLKPAVPVISSLEPQTVEVSTGRILEVSSIANGAFERYELVKRIGEGGFAKIFKASRQDDIGGTTAERFFAIKLLKPEMIEYLDRFKLEIKALARINHPNIVSYIESGETESEVYLVTEFIQGKTLSQIIREQRKSGSLISLQKVLAYTSAVAMGLEEAFNAGLVHRDVKPSNIMVVDDPDGTRDIRSRVKVLDFGLVRSPETPDEDLTKTGVILATPRYVAPEGALKKERTEKSDMYSLGVVLYEMITGTIPFKGLKDDDLYKAQVQSVLAGLKTFEDFQAVRPDLSIDVARKLYRILLKLLAKRPENRYKNYTLLRRDIENIK
ncbi:MAG: serine/threonine protein kinase [Candidatus Saganbacteria bacterium]|nr:serine/threonine protein kinase [Candidatus Saganbacteria bacterium]